MSIRVRHHRNGYLVADRIVTHVSAKPPDPVAQAARHARIREALARKGRAAWLWLHTEAEKDALTPEILKVTFLPMVPSFGCSCQPKASKYVEDHPPPVSGQKQWAIDWHNVVNVETKKPVWSPAASS